MKRFLNMIVWRGIPCRVVFAALLQCSFLSLHNNFKISVSLFFWCPCIMFVEQTIGRRLRPHTALTNNEEQTWDEMISQVLGLGPAFEKASGQPEMGHGYELEKISRSRPQRYNCVQNFQSFEYQCQRCRCGLASRRKSNEKEKIFASLQNRKSTRATKSSDFNHLIYVSWGCWVFLTYFRHSLSKFEKLLLLRTLCGPFGVLFVIFSLCEVRYSWIEKRHL